MTCHGKRIVEARGKMHAYKGYARFLVIFHLQSVVPYSMSIPTLFDLDNLQRSLERLCREVPVDAPWSAKRAKEWDSVTAAAWRDQALFTENTRRVFDTAIRVRTHGILAILTWDRPSCVWSPKKCLCCIFCGIVTALVGSWRSPKTRYCACSDRADSVPCRTALKRRCLLVVHSRSRRNWLLHCLRG